MIRQISPLLLKLPACFNTATGDVEDAPAPDPLNRFDVFEKEGAVYIKGQESDIKNGRRQPNVKCSSTGSERVVIVGGCFPFCLWLDQS